MPFFMSEEFSIVDCAIAPILWRLPAFGITLPEKQCKPLLQYMERMFEQKPFRPACLKPNEMHENNGYS